VISTGFEEQDGAQAQSETSNRSQVAGADGESRRQVAVVLETVIATHMVVQQWIARTAARKGGLFGQIAKAFCRSRQSSRSVAGDASRKRTRRMSVERDHPNMGRWRRPMMTVSPELNPDFGSDQEFRDEAGSRVLGMMNHRA
jgi:hypothetical protein